MPRPVGDWHELEALHRRRWLKFVCEGPFDCEDLLRQREVFVAAQGYRDRWPFFAFEAALADTAASISSSNRLEVNPGITHHYCSVYL